LQSERSEENGFIAVASGPESETDGEKMGKKRMSGPKKRFAAAMNPGYMLMLIFGKQMQQS
jgi:hypothetical protein